MSIDDDTTTTPGPSFWTSLVAGGIAGTAVDIGLFPVDTIKTRLQSPVGFAQAGGFRGVYNGVSAVAAGSAPGAAAFFATYEYVKATLPLYVNNNNSNHWSNNPSLHHMIAACLGETAACTVRVPTEVIKARMQTAKTQKSFVQTARQVIQQGDLYRGFGITLVREIPFACIQFPLYEHLKFTFDFTSDNPLGSAACGSASGALAAALTTPLDVLKTRLQLGVDAQGVPYQSAVDVWKRTSNRDLWKGIQPRVLWISLGGFIFFGAYEGSKQAIMPVLG